MKELILTFAIVILVYHVNSQSFNFIATVKASVYSGKEWDFTYETLKTPMNISFDRKKLNMVYESGKEYASFEILRIITTKETRENEKVTQVNYALEYKDKNGYFGYILYEFKILYGEPMEIIKLPVILKGWIFSYTHYSIY